MQTVESILVDMKRIKELTDLRSEIFRELLEDELDEYLLEKKQGELRMKRIFNEE